MIAQYERELSWLSFNERVLQEAADPSVPLVERVRFLGIYSNNQDEFFRVRIADVRRKILVHTDTNPERAQHYEDYLARLQDRILELSERFESIYLDLIRSLARAGIFLVNEDQVDEGHKQWLEGYFRSHILKYIAPFFIQHGKPLKHQIEDDAGYLLVRLTGRNLVHFAMIEIPTDHVPRFIELPKRKGRRQRTVMLLDNVIRLGLADIFGPVVKYDRVESWAIKLTRDAEYDLVDEIDMSLVERMDSALDQRLTAVPTRLVYDRDMPLDVLQVAKRALKISDLSAIVPGGRYHNFKDFISFPGNLGRQSLLNKPLPPVRSPRFSYSRNVFKAVRKHDILLHFPYHDFGHFTEWLRQAAYDPKVEKIQITLYRVASDSMVIKSLIDAARNGKRVEVVLELQARFDEQNNIEWARELTDEGVKVSFGITGLKVHAKLCLVSRREKGKIRPYAFIGTGNFHEKTARIYTDFGLFTANEAITHEAQDVFRFIEAPYGKFQFKHLWVSPTTQRQQIYDRIDQEIRAARAGKKARIRAKVNNLVDRGITARLYQASQAGVQVHLIIRGMCTLVTGLPESANITVISVVDRFLEHPRLCEFWNLGKPEVFISSADWMTRNLDRRVELAVPILDAELAGRISHLLDVQWRDRAKARLIDQHQTNTYVPRGNKAKLRSQQRIHDIISKWDIPKIDSE